MLQLSTQNHFPVDFVIVGAIAQRLKFPSVIRIKKANIPSGTYQILCFATKNGLLTSFVVQFRHGDWVQFNIAVDRRDKLERATNIELQDESFVVSGEKRETGVVAAVKDGYGFIRCAERDARVFFHFSEVISQDEEVDLNSEVEFTMSQVSEQI